MSLDKAAKYLESHGRGNDSMLVHMSPREVQSLQTLAKATGGSLTVNPHTGLAEAGWLDSLLPTIAGVALTGLTGGAINPLTAGLIVGGVQTARTGDIGKGLMAGLGAYGGSGLMDSLATTGANATAMNTANTAQEAAKAATQAPVIPPSEGYVPLANAPEGVYTGDLAGMSDEMQQNIINQRASVNNVYNAAGNAPEATYGQNIKAGISNLGEKGGPSALWNAMDRPTVAGLAAPVLEASSPQYKVPEVKEQPSSGRWLSKDFQASAPTRPNPYYTPAGLGYGGYAKGGEVQSYAFGGKTTATADDGSSGEGGIFSPRFANALAGQDSSGFGNLGFMSKLRNMLHTNDGSTAFGGFKNLSPDFGHGIQQAQAAADAGPRYTPQGLGYADGGLAMGGQPGQMFPGSNAQSQYATPTQAPASAMTAGSNYETTLDPYSGEPVRMAVGGVTKQQSMRLGDGIFRDTDPDTASLDAYRAALLREQKINAAAKMPKQPKTTPKLPMEYLGDIKTGVVNAAAGGQLGGYSDGGRMLKGPGDGMSDDIPATIGAKQPARLADGEFVVPADVVSHLGNGSTDAGAKRLYSMMDKVRQARTGNKKQGKKINADKYLPK